jgi:hypothetical protein
MNAEAATPMDARLAVSDCPLCDIYYGQPSNRCHGCPISMDSGSAYCETTPYQAAFHAFISWKCDPDLRHIFHEAAREEVLYLEELLKKEEAHELLSGGGE